ncbi:MAG: hypothetical protein QG608_1291 [Actinomycetota bacterium]|nr:hypothetical protein [Actinomycetota bacterium]
MPWRLRPSPRCCGPLLPVPGQPFPAAPRRSPLNHLPPDLRDHVTGVLCHYSSGITIGDSLITLSGLVWCSSVLVSITSGDFRGRQREPGEFFAGPVVVSPTEGSDRPSRWRCEDKNRKRRSPLSPWTSSSSSATRGRRSLMRRSPGCSLRSGRDGRPSRMLMPGVVMMRRSRLVGRWRRLWGWDSHGLPVPLPFTSGWAKQSKHEQISACVFRTAARHGEQWTTNSSWTRSAKTTYGPAPDASATDNTMTPLDTPTPKPRPLQGASLWGVCRFGVFWLGGEAEVGDAGGVVAG